MPEFFPRHQEQSESSPETFTGLWTEGFESPRRIMTRSGRLALATDIGLKKDRNEDVLALDTELDIFGVIDGMGGYENADQAARIVAEEILKMSDPSDSAQALHVEIMKRSQAESVGQGRACYMAAQLFKKELRVWGAGDCLLVVTDQKGNTKFMTEPGSLSLTPSERAPGRADVYTVDLINYDRVYMFTDGIYDNVDYEAVIKDAKDLPVEVAISLIGEQAMTGMRQGYINGVGEDEFGKPDNLSALLFELLPVPLRRK